MSEISTIPAQITLPLYLHNSMMKEMAELGATNYAKILFPIKDSMSEREAFRAYGEMNVKRWVKTELVGWRRTGTAENSKKNYSRAELLAASLSEKHNSAINKYLREK
jgi:hypothetical protein